MTTTMSDCLGLPWYSVLLSFCIVHSTAGSAVITWTKALTLAVTEFTAYITAIKEYHVHRGSNYDNITSLHVPKI